MPRKPKCKICKQEFERQRPLQSVCTNYQCMIEHGRVIKEKKQRKQHKADKDRIRKRTGKGGHYESLKTALHYYVKHILRKGEPCYTCGKLQRFGDSGGAFHVGHYMPAKTVDPRRFMLENLRIQCYSCNAAKSGNQAEYRRRLTEEMGIDHVEWLECEANHNPLSEQYPTVESIQAEIKKYKALAKAGADTYELN